MVGANFIDLNRKYDSSRPRQQQWSYKWNKANNKERGSMVKDFVKYIGRLDGTAIDETCINHSCFGSFINDNRPLEELSMKELRYYTSKVAEKGIEMFNTVISLKEDEAIRAGFTDRETWKDMINKKVKDIAEEYGINPSKLEYIASIHSEEGHIHCHLVFWKEDELEDGRLNKKKDWNKIRKDLNKEIFRQELDENYELQNEGKKEIGKESLKFLDDNLKNSIYELTPSLYKTYFNNKINSKSIDKIYKMLNELVVLQKEKALENGTKVRYVYKYQNAEVKDKLFEIAKEIVASSVACNKEYVSYVKSTVKINELIGNISRKNPVEKVMEKAENDMLIKISNNILSFVKAEKIEEGKLKKEEYEKKHQEFEENKKQYEKKQAEFKKNQACNSVRRLCNQTYNICRNNNLSQKASINRIRYSELSKTAKKELALKNKFKGSIDWEM